MTGRRRGRWVSVIAALAVFGLVFAGFGAGRPAIAAARTPAAVTAQSVRSATATIGGYPVWAHFTDPTGADDYTIVNEFIRLVNGAPKGATIQGSIFLLSLNSVATALVNAQDRGVTVKVALDGGDESETWAGITTVKKLTNRTFCHNGKGGTSCISTDSSGIMHAKFFTFSSTTDPNGVLRSNVSWFGSANFVTPTGTQRFNNTITVYGDKALKNGLDADFADLYTQHHYTGNDYYDAATSRGYHLGTAADSYFSPEAAGQTDTIVNRLNDLTPDASCRVRIAQAFVTGDRPALLSQVEKFRAGGCKVWMVVGTESGHLNMDKTTYNDLVAAGVDIHGGAVHDKSFLVYGKFGTDYAYRVYTGSQNWSSSALSRNDELFVKLAPETGATHPLYDAYYAHFNDAYDLNQCTSYNC